MQKIVRSKTKQGNKKQKTAIFGPKMSYLGVLGCKFEKLFSYFQHEFVKTQGFV